jgi:hypothetical protein
MTAPVATYTRGAGRIWRGGLAFAVVAACLLPASPAISQYRAVTVPHGGSVRGRVTLAAQSKVPPGLAITKDDVVCGSRPSFSRLLLGRDRGVANAVVFLKDIAAGKPFPAVRPSVLMQRHCEFLPHVMLKRGDVSLDVVNNDPVLHNVHAYAFSDNPTTLFNIAQPIKGQRSRIAPSQFRNAAIVMVTCDAGHPWMTGYIVREDHPYYAVTDDQGRYRLNDIPPGTYTLVLWHEGVEVQQTEREHGVVTKYRFEPPYAESRMITIPPRASVQQDFELHLR